MTRKPPFPAVLGLFFLSGATSLLYQIVWVRHFTFLFGATVLAVSTVLASFMGGLALGGLWSGRAAGRWERPLRVYGLLELALAAYAALVPGLLEAADPLYAWLYPSLEASFGVLTAVRFAVSLAVLLPPTFLMGATLPVLTRHALPGARGGRGRVAVLYSVNTLGAVCGTVVATFLLLPAIGLDRTLAIGVCVNVLVGVWAVILGRGAPEAEPAGFPEEEAPAPPPLPFPRPLLHGTVGVLGFSALAFEVLWTRALALTLGTTIYAFAVVLAVFLLGIGAGSAVAARLLREGRTPVRWFVACPAIIGLLALGLVPLFDRLPGLFVSLAGRTAGTWGESLAVKFLIAGLSLLPPTLVSGAAFPLAAGIDRSRESHRSVGDVYAANTLGAILGSWAAGFLILPLLGLQRGIELAALLPVAMTCLLLLCSRGARSGQARGTAAGLAVAAVAAWALLPDWNRALMTRGSFVLGLDLQKAGASALPGSEGEIVFLEEGITTTVTVRRKDGEYTMQMNGVTEASTAGDLSTQVSVASLPLLVHPHPERVLVIGLGGGITAATAARFPTVESVECVEIARGVVRAAEAHFRRANRGILEDPRFRLVVGDGRNHLRLSRGTFDAIVSLPSHVWNAGTGSLMTSEFYALCRERLRPGGLLCSWIQGYSLSGDALRSVLAAVGRSFPRVTLWRGTWGDLLILAGDETFVLDVERILARGRDPALGEVLRESGFPDLPSLLSLQLLAGDALDTWVGNHAPNTDDRPLLEFEAPKLLYADPMPELLESLHAAAGDADPHVVNAPAGLAEAVLRGRRARALESRGRFAFRESAGERGIRFLEEAFTLLPTAPSIRRTLAGALGARGAALVRRGELAAAARSYTRALEVDPDLPDTYEGLAHLHADAGNPQTAMEVVDEGLEHDPDSPDLRALRASILIRQRRFAEARDEAAASLALDPRHLEGHVALGTALAELGETVRAESVLVAGLALHPDSEELRARARKLALMRRE